MQGKGAGPVNRVELESQVLCAALRQSFHLREKIGGFTAVRELSHLFPDLLPPPEKDDDDANSNKANYYAVLSIKPQIAANGVISAYLRSVRKFLKQKTVKENRQEYNRILNAGFILRKPRLRLSHDLVVTRRWLHEESRRSSMAQQEITVDQSAAVKTVQAMLAADGGLHPRVPIDPTETPTSPIPVIQPAAGTSTPPVPPVPPLSGKAVGSAPKPTVNVPPVPPLPGQPRSPEVPAAEEPAVAPAAAQTTAQTAPAPPLPPVIAAAMKDGSNQLKFDSTSGENKTVVPPVPPLPAKFYDPAAYGETAQNQAPPAPAPAPAPDPVPTPSPPPAPVTPQSVQSGQTAAAPQPEAPPMPPLPVQSEAVQSLPAEPPVPPLPPLPVAADGQSADVPPPVPPMPAPSEAPVSPAPEPATAPNVDTEEFPPPLPESLMPQDEPAVAVQPEEAPPPLPPSSEMSQPMLMTAGDMEGSAVDLTTTRPLDVPPELAAARAAALGPETGSNGPNGGQTSAPAAAPTPTPAYTPQPTAASITGEHARPPGRISKEATFVFDESALRKPVPSSKGQIPMVIQLLEAAQIIGALEVQALIAQMEFAPNVPVERLILNAGYVSQQELASIKLGESLLQQGRITIAQFQVAIYDERTSGLRMAESLQVRGWLSVEVRNAIDEWHRKRS